jgi:hypothetical protein
MAAVVATSRKEIPASTNPSMSKGSKNLRTNTQIAQIVVPASMTSYF